MQNESLFVLNTLRDLVEAEHTFKNLCKFRKEE